MLLLNIGTPDVHVLYNVYLMSVNPGCKPGGFVSYCLFALFASFCLQCILYIFQCTYSSTEKITTEIILGINLQCT